MPYSCPPNGDSVHNNIIKSSKDGEKARFNDKKVRHAAANSSRNLISQAYESIPQACEINVIGW